MDGNTILVSGLPIFYVAAGAGVPVLFLHGNTGSSLWWRDSMELPGCRTVALDLPNFGRSGPVPGFAPENARLETYADYLAAFIEAMKLDRPVLVGHSLGGAVAQALVAKRPELARALVLVDSAAPSGLVTPAERHPAIEMMRANPAVLSMALKAVVPAMTDEAWFAALVEDAKLMAAPAWIGNAEALSRFDLRGKLSGYANPVLVVWGRKDLIVTEAMARETVAAFPNASLEILEGVGHSVMAEDPALWKRILLRFLENL
ncbi:MAG: alpha/beta hydrolase [Spirochaetales bacterium]|nr:alpha/beta hydrolase [Spirochaetales bacterium]